MYACARDYVSYAERTGTCTKLCSCYDINVLLFLSCSSLLKLWPGQGVHEQPQRRRKMKSEKSLLNPYDKH